MAIVETNLTTCNFSNPEHLQAIATLIDVYIHDEMGGGTPLSKLEQNRLVAGLQEYSSIVLLAEADGEYAGLLIAFENFSTFTAKPMVNIHDVIVRPEYRGKGIGRLLMNGIIAEAEKRGASRVTLEVREDNTTAQNLYSSLGFHETEPSHLYWRKYL
ncbi:N-acetyltransferase [Bacteroidia bacterium]|nr:N-acetyltransferase [Bacteroidia bacterium]